MNKIFAATSSTEALAIPTIEVPIKQLHAKAVIPSKAFSSDACYDVSSVEDVFIAPGKVEKVRLGFALALPDGWEAQLRPRSGLSSKGIIGMFGTIDANYRGELSAIILNMSGVAWFCEPGMRVAQMAIRPIYNANFTITAELNETDRGNGGFGSTGLKGV